MMGHPTDPLVQQYHYCHPWSEKALILDICNGRLDSGGTISETEVRHWSNFVKSPITVHNGKDYTDMSR